MAELGLSEAATERVRAWLLSLAGPPTAPADSLIGGPTVLEALTASGWSPITTEPLGPLQGASRYVLLERIGSGGMGEVWRVRDQNLNRTMAMKLIHPKLSGALERFIEEAQVTAQLAHPGIVPVYDLGRLPDGRYYFTMQEVRGQTLLRAIRAVHGASSPQAWGRAGAWSLRGLVSALQRAAEAVAFAHDRGVIHRDLKPANVLLGRFGAVQVVDWGIARLVGRPAPSEEPVVTDRSQSDGQETLAGVVLGTPAYMPPEQAYGWVNRIDARSDVYALGATLYHILSGAPPYRDGAAGTALQQVLAGPPRPLGSRGGPPAPEPLVGVCRAAMTRELGRRTKTAGEVAASLSEWLAR